MKLIAIGRLKSGPEKELFERYSKRLRPSLSVVEISPSKGSVYEQKRRDALSLLEHCPDNAIVVVLDEGGKSVGSVQFAENIRGWQESGRPICFIIGGAEGLDKIVLERADRVISFGVMTWPHMLVRVMLAEQIFRAQAINLNHPYHKETRPD
ncbi:23S rRNA (pseudouridine(1915)-N(3))-methyltransferase RlmH [Swingsia samuiensis]|uniref:Ribosomal RNA large subunit methyltransferase H n=1 Tax=Swingsia samuiensis TaxID=1293412 RepID=A0A4Y6UJZ8_9PROT|nr:23S rRNA (pseudouridine(1915)-N(3))-methyltransferase RlmH [Swingsia samuiensis]QDH16968.1 23S rRNA (pseudouridine(1915)-N(3))-methyltransferase RlmH [Swingsia samuiensis]